MPTLDWLNRADAFTTEAKVPYRLLEQELVHGTSVRAQLTPVRAEPAEAGGIHDNLLILGDNLEALKALLPFYRGQVKCIFIDPPYNTKSAFEHYDDNLEHAQWLSMMLPRLQLLRELLREDGSIWVTIDDNEGHYLKVLMDEVFGRGNFVANVVWEKKFSPQNDAHQLSINHDHLLVYAKRGEIWRPALLPRSTKQLNNFKNPDADPRGGWLSADYTCAKTRDERPNLFYAITNPITGKQVLPSPTRVWAYDRESTKQNQVDNLLYWGAKGENERPRLKKFVESVQAGTVPTTIWRNDEVGNNQDAKKEVLAFGGETTFTTPKPEGLIQRTLQLATTPNDLILDSFLGSGTTAAVAHKMGRRWIGIEMGEHAATHCLPRLQKVIDGEQGGISKTVGWGVAAEGGEWTGGGGFRFMRLGETIFDDAGRINPAVRFATLAAFIWQQETGTAFDPASATCTAKPGTPYLGTYYIINSYSCTADKGQGPISLEIPAKTPEMEPKFSIYLLFNGILGDKRPASGNVLTRDVLAALLNLHAREASANTPLVVYGESVRVGPARLAATGVTFKQIPYDVRARQ